MRPLFRPIGKTLAKAARVGLVIAGVFACLATSAPRYRFVRSYPTWNLARPPAPGLGCALVEAWVSKTGKTGIGLSVLMTSDGPCEVAVERALVSIGARHFEAEAVPPPMRADRGRRVHFYAPVAFDNETLWNSGEREAVIHLRVRAGSERADWALGAEQIRPEAHDRLDYFSPAPIDVKRARDMDVITVTPTGPMTPTDPGGPIEVVP